MAEPPTPGSMDPREWARVREILHEALELSPDARSAYLDRACGGDAGLRAEVESLITASEGSAVLDRPAIGTVTMEQAVSATSGLQPGQTLGHYQVVEKIGEGGMGSVYKAIDKNLGRPAALKVISRAYASWEEQRRLGREAKAASALNSPNIVTIYEFNTESGQDFIAMEYVKGETLHKLIGERALPLEAMIEYARQAAGAVGKAHQAGIVHRDLKPANIMVTDEGVVKVLDFGLARQPESSHSDSEVTQTQALTKAGMVVGTPSYMSPEQAMGEPAGPLSDIFSFGVILYQIACGRRPFEGKNSQATLYQIAHKDPPDPLEVNPATPRALAALIEKCLKKAPGERPQSMAEVAEALAELLHAPALTKARTPSRWLVLAGGVLCAVIAWLWISRNQSPPAPAPQRQLAWSLEAQKMQGGKAVGEPYAASPSDAFEAGWRFRLRLRSPESGFLYLINEGPGERGASRIWVLYPAEPSAAALPPNQETLTGWYVFDQNPGTEKVWIVWADRSLDAMEAPLRGSEHGEVKDRAQSEKIRALLAGMAKAVRAAGSPGFFQIRGVEGVLGDFIELRHR